MHIVKYIFSPGPISVQYTNSSACSTLSKTGGKSVQGIIRSTAGSQDFSFPPSQLDHNQSLVSIYEICILVEIIYSYKIFPYSLLFQAHVAFPHAETCFSGLLAAPYGPQNNVRF